MVPQEELLRLTSVYDERTATETHEIVTRAMALRSTWGTIGQGDELLKRNSLYPVEVSAILLEFHMPISQSRMHSGAWPTQTPIEHTHWMHCTPLGVLKNDFLKRSSSF